MSDDVLERILAVFVGRLGVRDIRLTGGEPTLHPGFRGLTRRLKDAACSVRVISNGAVLYRGARGQELLQYTDDCWISVYGTTVERHAAIAGRGALELEEALELVVRVASTGYRVGVSVLVSPGDSELVVLALDRLLAFGIRRARLIPVQPDGRALSTGWTWAAWPREVRQIYRALTRYPRRYEFDELTMNDPLDLESSGTPGCQSCLLLSRSMWSVVPSGDVYTCCFNAYDAGHLLGNIADDGLRTDLASSRLRCRGLDDRFWSEDGTHSVSPSCPIRALDVLADGEVSAALLRT